MEYVIVAVVTGFLIDCILGDPRFLVHPVVLIGKLIALLEKTFRHIPFKKAFGEKVAGGLLWVVVVFVSFIVPWGILFLCRQIHPLLALAVESIMCWQILAAKSLKKESMAVFYALKSGDLEKARYNVSMIVGRDTEKLSDLGVTRATVETVAENTSDGVIAPLLFLALGGAPLGFLYKAVNTMDSMLGYTDPPYTNIGFVPAKMDDVFNFFPARLSAVFMLLAGLFCRLDVKNGLKIFRRDRYKHASPNSAQTEAVCAGLLGLRLAGDAVYHGILHKKEYIGDAKREIRYEDIPLSCRLMYVTSILALIVFMLCRFGVCGLIL